MGGFCCVAERQHYAFSMKSCILHNVHCRMSNSRFLSEKDLTEYWENFSGLDSDADGAVSDSDSLEDPSFIPQAQSCDDHSSSSDREFEEELVNSNGEPNADDANLPSCSSQELTVTRKKVFSTRKKFENKNITWKKKSLQLNEEQLHFHGNINIPGNIMELDTPYQFFSYFFSNELINKIVQETNLYAVQKRLERPPVFTAVDIRQYIGVILYMSLVNMPNTRSYWSQQLEFGPIKSVMSVNEFEKIRQFIHFNDNHEFVARGQVGHDKLHKIRPVLDHLNMKFSTIPLEQHLSLDEQMCSTKIRSHIKQYMPMKPHKWGFKLFVLSGISGFAYKIEIYTGQENFEEVDGEPNLGATSNVVIRLARIIPRNQNYRLYHDNYYTSLPLMVYLAKEGIYSLGTIRRNRLPNCKLPTEADLKKANRGTSEEYVTTVDGVEISSSIWKDNKYVSLLSSYAGTNPITTVARFDRKEKKMIQVDCPNVIREYNKHMGGVDLLDSLMGRYKIYLKSRKWYIRLFYHLIDLCTVNAWLLYKRVHNQKGHSNLKNQYEFRAEIAACLCSVGTTPYKRARSSGVENELAQKRTRGPTQHVPPKEVRLDQTGHWPIIADSKIRCKFPKCKGFTHTKCEKCGVALCLNKNNNCFKFFHNS